MPRAVSNQAEKLRHFQVLARASNVSVGQSIIPSLNSTWKADDGRSGWE
jgi:hypothetical protein